MCFGFRGRFEVLCSSFMQRCLQTVSECLIKAEMNRSDIHKVCTLFRSIWLGPEMYIVLIWHRWCLTDFYSSYLQSGRNHLFRDIATVFLDSCWTHTHFHSGHVPELASRQNIVTHKQNQSESAVYHICKLADEMMIPVMMERVHSKHHTLLITPCPEKNIQNIIYLLSLKEMSINFNNFWYRYFWHNWPSNDRPIYHLTQCLLLHYLGENEPTKYALKWTKIRLKASPTLVFVTWRRIDRF